MAKEWLFDYGLGSRFASNLVDPFFNDLIYDTATDSFFYMAGVAVALAHFGLLRIAPIPVLIGVLAISVGLANYWIPARQRIETAGTPYFIRLNRTDLGLDPRFSELTAEEFRASFLKEDKARSMGLRPAVRDIPYPFQFLMDDQTDKKQIIAVGGDPLIPRFFIAITNERVIRQEVNEPCNTRFITFRDLLDSDIEQKEHDGALGWEIRTRPPKTAAAATPACDLEPSELLIVNQVPTIAVAATEVGELVTFRDHGLTSSTTPKTAPDVAAAVAAINPQDTGHKLEIFLDALASKTVIWVLDNGAVVEGWTTALRKSFPSQSIGIIEFEELQ